MNSSESRPTVLFPPFIDINEMKNQEIDGNDYDKHQYRSEKLAESDPQEKVQQTYLKQIIK